MEEPIRIAEMDEAPCNRKETLEREQMEGDSYMRIFTGFAYNCECGEMIITI